jgi:hypothetical protein
LTDLAIVLVPSSEGGWIAMEPDLRLAGTGSTVYEAVFDLHALMEEHAAPPSWRNKLATGLRLTPLRKAATASSPAPRPPRPACLRVVR